MFTVSLELLLKRDLRLDPHEAVAIAQAVAADHGVPCVDNVQLRSDGTVACVAHAVTPSARQLAEFLHRLLPPGARVPAALQYAVARGLGEAEAPPFESIDAFSTVLERFENGDRAQVIRGVLARAARPEPAPAPVPAPAARVRLFEPPPVPVAPRRSHARMAGVALALCASAVIGFVSVRSVYLRDAAPADDRPTEMARASLNNDGQPAAAIKQVGTSGSEPAPFPAVASVARNGAAVGRMPGALIGAGFSPAFSSTGNALFFHTGDPKSARSAIAMAASSDWSPGSVRIVTLIDDGSRNYHAQPSPDGEWIAFDSDRDGERGVYLAKRDGSGARRISGEGYAALPSWSPDSMRLTFVRAEADRPSVWNLWLEPTGGGEARRLTRYRYGQTWSASWFPDSVRVCFTHEDVLTLLDLESGRMRQFRSPVEGALVRTASVSPDGSRIIFQVLRHGVWMLDVARGTMQRVLADPTAEEFTWTPDGTRVAFHSRSGGRWGIHLVTP